MCVAHAVSPLSAPGLAAGNLGALGGIFLSFLFKFLFLFYLFFSVLKLLTFTLERFCGKHRNSLISLLFSDVVCARLTTVL